MCTFGATADIALTRRQTLRNVSFHQGHGHVSLMACITPVRASALTPIQHIETQKIHPRTFHIHPSGRLLVAQHNLPVNVRDDDTVKAIPAGLSVFRIGNDGKLTFARKYDIDVGDKTMFWMGMVPL